MRQPFQQVEREVPQVLGELLGAKATLVSACRSSGDKEHDLVLRLGKHRFVVECKGNGSAASVALAVEHLRSERSRVTSGVIPVVAVPFMGATGKRLCRGAGVSWIDLSGNAHVEAPGLRIHVEGKPNRFKRRGRPENVFAPKSSRITRWMLSRPKRSWRQQELAQATGLTEGYTSRVVRRLEELELLCREADGSVRPKDPNLLLDAWAERYDFDKHEVLKGHVSAHSSDSLLKDLVKIFRTEGVDYAATALPSAWLRDRFARYRITSFFLEHTPGEILLEQAGFRAGDRGANVWLVTPNDEGVFHEVTELNGVRCVSSIQTYLDLLWHPERAKDAAEQLRGKHLRWAKT